MYMSEFTSAIQINPHLATSEIILRKILVALDFSTQTQQVLKTAVSVAQAFNAEVLLVNASTPTIYTTGAAPIPIEMFDVNLEIAKKSMQELVSSEPAFSTLKHRQIVRYAGAIELVQQLVEDEKVDLVIAGSHGARGLERLALGSVAESILHNVLCPTIIVGPLATPGKHPFRSILFVTDLEETGLRAAQYASGLAERFHGHLTFLHVFDPNALYADGTPRRSEQEARQELERLLPPDLNAYCSAGLRIEYGDPREIITQVSNSECSSLIVAGVRERSLSTHAPWSTLSHLIRSAHCPVLCVRRHFA